MAELPDRHGRAYENPRSAAIYLYEGIACNPERTAELVAHRDPRWCLWCGEPIQMRDPSDYRRARRNYHRGDEHELTDRNCVELLKSSRVWKARSAAIWLDLTWCFDCGQVCWKRDAEGAYRELVEWEADHTIALVDGGSHDVTNIACRCVPCHRDKTAREAIARTSGLVEVRSP